MTTSSTRREFLAAAGAGAGAMALGAMGRAHAQAPKRDYKISLAAWSLHRTIGRRPDQRPFLDLPKMAKDEFGIDAIELVSGMLGGRDAAYFGQLAKAASDAGVKILLTMVDGEGDIGHEKENRRTVAVDRHKFWIDATADLGGHSIRMNWAGAPEGVMQDDAALKALVERSAPHFRALCEHGDTKNINVIIENHWGPSSYPKAMTMLIETVNHPRFGTLPDFGNFPDDVDRYEATDVLMKHAKAVSAKCYDFDDATGLETKIDYARMLDIVCGKHGYNGYIGIEYEGDRLSEAEGIKRCKALLEKLRGA